MFSDFFAPSELQFERMMSYYTGTVDVTRSKPTSTWKFKPPNLTYTDTALAYFGKCMSHWPSDAPLHQNVLIDFVMNI